MARCRRNKSWPEATTSQGRPAHAALRALESPAARMLNVCHETGGNRLGSRERFENVRLERGGEDPFLLLA
jgi:hypothetical protein